MTNLTTKQITDLNNFAQAAKNAELGTVVNNLITGLNGVVVEGTPVNAVNASTTLTFSGPVTHGEYLAIQKVDEVGDKYEFTADANQTVSEVGNIAVDIESDTTKASGTLTVDTQPTAGDTMIIGTRVYTFVANGSDDADGKVSVGTDKATAQENIVAAINGTDGHNIPHPDVTAADFATDDCVITAKVGGTKGNGIATTETFTAETNVFAAGTLTSGADCIAANAVVALLAAIAESDTQGVGAAEGDSSNIIVLTADVAGAASNFIYVSNENLINGAFPDDVTSLEGGVDGTVAAENAVMRDDSWLYICVAANTVSGKNWRRITLGTAY